MEDLLAYEAVEFRTVQRPVPNWYPCRMLGIMMASGRRRLWCSRGAPSPAGRRPKACTTPALSLVCSVLDGFSQCLLGCGHKHLPLFHRRVLLNVSVNLDCDSNAWRQSCTRRNRPLDIGPKAWEASQKGAKMRRNKEFLT